MMDWRPAGSNPPTDGTKILGWGKIIHAGSGAVVTDKPHMVVVKQLSGGTAFYVEGLPKYVMELEAWAAISPPRWAG